MRYTCLWVFAKCWRQVQRKAGSLQVIKKHSRMLHHQHHVADPLYCNQFSSIARITKSLHLLLHLISFVTNFQFGSKFSLVFQNSLFFPDKRKDIFQVFISDFAFLMCSWVCRDKCYYLTLDRLQPRTRVGSDSKSNTALTETRRCVCSLQNLWPALRWSIPSVLLSLHNTI